MLQMMFFLWKNHVGNPKQSTLSAFSHLAFRFPLHDAENMDTESMSLPTPTSDEAVPKAIQQGFEKMVVQAGVGLLVGGMTGIVLSRGGGSSARKVLAGFGAGAGLGAAWTRTSMNIEDLLSSSSSSK
jgi:hypothetical protein